MVWVYALSFTDNDFASFCEYFYKCLQKSTKDQDLRKDLCIATNILGSPYEKRSAQQASFRRDLRIICKAVGVGESRLVLSDDCRFLDTVMKSDAISQKFKIWMENNYLQCPSKSSKGDNPYIKTVTGVTATESNSHAV